VGCAAPASGLGGLRLAHRRGMRIILEAEESIRLVDGGGEFVLESAPGIGLSPFHLLAASLATCTRSVLEGWGREAGLRPEGLEIGVAWELGGDPVRVSELRMEVAWPGLPAEREAAARRVAAHCTIHHTLTLGTRLSTEIRVSEP